MSVRYTVRLSFFVAVIVYLLVHLYLRGWVFGYVVRRKKGRELDERTSLWAYYWLLLFCKLTGGT